MHKEKYTELVEIILANQEQCFRIYGNIRMWRWLVGKPVNPPISKAIVRIMKKYDILAKIHLRRM